MIDDKVFKALSDRNRRKIINLLKKKEMTAGEIADHFEISKPSVSEHLKVLRNADLINSEKKGQYITYFLDSTILQEVISYFMEIISNEQNKQWTKQNLFLSVILVKTGI